MEEQTWIKDEQAYSINTTNAKQSPNDRRLFQRQHRQRMMRLSYGDASLGVKCRKAMARRERSNPR